MNLIALTKIQWVWTIYALSLMQTVDFQEGDAQARKHRMWMLRLEQDLVLMGLDEYHLTRGQAARLCRLLRDLDGLMAYEDEVGELYGYLQAALEDRALEADPERATLN